MFGKTWSFPGERQPCSRRDRHFTEKRSLEDYRLKIRE